MSNILCSIAVCVCVYMCAQSCLTLCDPMDCSWPASCIHGIFQERILEWVYHFLLQGIFSTQGLNQGLLYLLQRQAVSLPLSHLEVRKPLYYSISLKLAVLILDIDEREAER